MHDFDQGSLILDHSKIRKMPFWMIQIAKNKVFGQSLEFSVSDWLDIGYFDGTFWFVRFGYCITHIGSFKNQKNSFWMIQIAKNQDFGHFLQFGVLDWLDIAYSDRTKYCTSFGHHLARAESFKNTILNDPKSQKWGFGPFYGVWSVEIAWW